MDGQQLDLLLTIQVMNTDLRLFTYNNVMQEMGPMGPHRPFICLCKFASTELMMLYKCDVGAWFMHCHLEIHLSWGLSVVFIVKNGQGPLETLPHPPADYPRC